MDFSKIIWFLIIGGIAGWLSGVITKGTSFGFIGNIIVGILGAVIGGFIFDKLGVKIIGGNIAELITALVGAIVLISIMNLIKK